MATVRPLRGIRYNLSRIGDLAEVIAPPYDVISAEQQELLHRRSAYNVVRLELGRRQSDDSDGNNRYTRARAFFDQWLAEGVLSRELGPAIYVHRHEFAIHGKSLHRIGIIAGLQLEDWSTGNVLPHEDTLPKPKQDRLNLMRACQCNFSPIMALFEDSEVRRRLQAWTTGRSADTVFSTEGGEKHSLWVVRDADMIDWITGRLARVPAFIADGHHRYETALQYRREIEAANGPLPLDHPANYVLTTLFDFDDPGLVVMPTHRIIRGVDQGKLQRLPHLLGELCQVQIRLVDDVGRGVKAGDLLETLMRPEPTAQVFGFYGLPGGVLHLVTLARDRAAALMAQVPRSEAYRRLDVAILHHVILEGLLGIDSAKIDEESHVSYTRDEMEALQAVRQGNAQLAVLLNPTSPQQLRDVALAGDRMPQKSTYFYPKLPTGLVINSWR